jgi:hypothetical protein
LFQAGNKFTDFSSQAHCSVMKRFDEAFRSLVVGALLRI